MGRSFDEGSFGVVGYITAGVDDMIPRLGTGGIIVRGEVVAGAVMLVRPRGWGGAGVGGWAGG